MSDSTVVSAYIVATIVTILLVAFLIYLGAKRTRVSHTAFALVFTTACGMLASDMTLYAVCSFPILALLIGENALLNHFV